MYAQNVNGKNRMYGNVEIIDISKIHEVCVSVYFVSEGKSPTHSIYNFGQIVIEINVSLLFSDEMNNDHYDAMLPIEEREVRYICLSLFLY
jgi:hypothetical protein